MAEETAVETFPEERVTLEIPEDLMKRYGANWKTKKVVIRLLGIGEAMRIADESMNVTARNDKTARVDYRREIAIVGAIVNSVVEAPWKVNDKHVAARIPRALADWLYSAIENGGVVDEKKNLS